jgi:hypothetical protein
LHDVSENLQRSSSPLHELLVVQFVLADVFPFANKYALSHAPFAEHSQLFKAEFSPRITRIFEQDSFPEQLSESNSPWPAVYRIADSQDRSPAQETSQKLEPQSI